MSDPVSNTEIEDVLSSIRRLVSDEPAQRPEPEPETPQKVERLVLTPAFRVSDPDPQSETTEPQDPKAQAGDASTEEDHQDAPEEVLHDIAQQPEPQVDTGYEAEEDWSDEKLVPSEALDEDADAENSEAALDAEPELSPEPAEFKDPADMSLEDRIAELEAAIQQAPEEWEPDGSEEVLDDETRPLSAEVTPEVTVDEAVAGTAPETDADEEILGAVPFVEEDEIADVVVDMPVATAGPETAEDDSPAPIADLAEAEIDVEALAESLPEMEVASEPEPEVVEAEIHIAPEVDFGSQTHDHDELLDDAFEDEISDDDAFENLVASEDETIDEAALRELVAETVREELQGALGERITRNVRRLIRREIQRALALKDLE